MMHALWSTKYYEPTKIGVGSHFWYGVFSLIFVALWSVGGFCFVLLCLTNSSSLYLGLLNGVGDALCMPSRLSMDEIASFVIDETAI